MKRIWLSVRDSDIRNILAIIITLGCFLIIYLLIIKEVPQGNKDILNIAIGFLFGGAFAGVVGYFYGSSRSREGDVKRQTTTSSNQDNK